MSNVFETVVHVNSGNMYEADRQCKAQDCYYRIRRAVAVQPSEDIPFEQEVVTCSAAVEALIPETDVAIELGGEDAKITFYGQTIEQRMNGTCAGGTGAFIDQMAATAQYRRGGTQ